MRILFVVPYTPTPIRVRPYNLVKRLAARGHRLTLATVCTGVAERGALGELEALGVHVIAERLPRWRSLLNCLCALPTRVPLQAVYCQSPALRSRIERELRTLRLTGEEAGVGSGERYDVVHVEHLRGAPYGLHLEHTPVVWDSVDCISYLFEQSARDSHSLTGRLMGRLDLARTRRYEGWLVGQFHRVLVTSRTDQQALEALSQVPTAEAQTRSPLVEGRTQSLQDKIEKPSAFSAANKSHITVLPNGVDLAYFCPGDEPRQPGSIVISGKMSYHANITAVHYLVEEIMPLVWAQQPGARVTVVGAYPPRRMRQLAGRFPGRVDVTGTVPDLRPHLRRAAVAVAPVRYGAGIQNKVLEAMACGTPVVATDQACHALDVTPERDLLTATTAQDFARQVLRLLEDGELAARLGATGRCYVEAHHDWDSVVEQLEGIYVGCISPQRRRAGRVSPISHRRDAKCTE